MSDPQKRAAYDQYGKKGLKAFADIQECYEAEWVVETRTESEILTIDIKPRWKKGTKITFPDKGNEQPNQLPCFGTDRCTAR